MTKAFLLTGSILLIANAVVSIHKDRDRIQKGQNSPRGLPEKRSPIAVSCDASAAGLENAFSLGLYNPEYGSRCYEAQAQKALCSLDKYAAQLGSFLTEAKFDSRRFSSLARSLEIGLLDITRAVAEVAHWCRQVYDRLIFVNYVFRAMDDCSKGSVHFHSTTGEATHWAYCVVQPYVQLLGIHGLNGYDDGQNSVYANAVGLQIKYLTFWKDMLKYMADAPLNVRLWVDRQLYEAEKMIEHLTCDRSDRRYGSIKCSPI